ncbi:sulfurtransferase [Myxococcota bacterium]|nr:sulfurtransferase [Myxococcota bacterium]
MIPLWLLAVGAALAGVFVSPEQAAALLAQGATAIDARGESAWEDGHVPSAAPLSWLSLRDGLLKVGRLTDQQTRLQASLRAAGVRQGAPVLVYDAGREGWGEAGRLWWTLRYLGHDQAHILDGGWPAWVSAGLPVATDAARPPAGDFSPRPDETRRARVQEVQRAVTTCAAGPCEVVFWDSRERREYDGQTPYGEARGGHLPGAVHLWFADLLDAQGFLRPRAELQAELAARGITPDKQVVPYCTGGVRSGFAVAVLEELGFPHAANYDGSMWEWTGDPTRPVEGGPGR